MGVRVGVANEWAWQIFFLSSMQIVGVTTFRGLWALKWAWQIVGATGLGDLWALEWTWHLSVIVVCGR